MARMIGRKPAHQLYSPAGRKNVFPRATYPMLVHTSRNVAAAIKIVHKSGCVVGDINHSGVLVSDDATIVLIDSDSFQFTYNGRVFPCKVGVPEFTPPELQGKDLSRVTRTTNHDNFGLAVLIFYILMMGRHPFAGRFLGQGDMPMERAIAEYRFAYSARRGATQMEPPPNVPTLLDLPLGIADAFERAFGPAGTASTRADPSEWATLLEKAAGELVPCSVVASHHFFRTAKTCPWCRMESAYPGFQAFVPFNLGQAPISLTQLIAAVQAVTDPGPLPDLATLMPTVRAKTPSSNVTGLRKQKIRRWMLAIFVACFSLYLLPLSMPGPTIGTLTLALSALIAFFPSKRSRAESRKYKGARAAWSNAKRVYELAANNTRLVDTKKNANKLIDQLRGIDSEEAQKLVQLANRKRELQLRHFLEQHYIDQVKIKGVGNARKLTLRSYGIETAADVDYTAIVRISGFGPTIANALVAWRRQVEGSFRFDPQKEVNPTDIATLKAEYHRRRVQLIPSAQQTVANLQKIASDVAAARRVPTAEAVAAWESLKTTEEIERAAAYEARNTSAFCGYGYLLGPPPGILT